MPAYKLYYFNYTGMAENIRFILSYAGVDFDDIRIDYQKEWPTMKSKMPMGQLPILEVDGKQTYQSIAICRYLAKELKMAGNNNWENLQIDMAVDTINDLRIKIAQTYWLSNQAIKEERMKTLVDVDIPFYLQKFDDMVKANNGYFALGHLTWADIFFAGCLDNLDGLLKRELIADYPNLKAIRNKILANENIKKYLANRPVSAM